MHKEEMGEIGGIYGGTGTGARLAGRMRRLPGVAQGRRVLGWLGRLRVTVKLSAALFFGLCLPMAVVLLLLSEGRVKEAEIFAVLALVTCLVLLVPLANFVGWLVVLRDVREVNRLCLAVRSGDYGQQLALPPEGEDEHELLRMKRNLNWMVHAIASREQWLQGRLDASVQSRRKYEELSMVDELTGVYNRRFFETRLVECAGRARSGARPFFLMLLDCDRFKEVNDTLGHQAGDDLLRNLGAILRSCLREAVDCPFRYGGDEFGVLFGCGDIERVRDAAERIRRRFKDLAVANTSLSVGVARFDPALPQEDSLRRLKDEADQALYQAKSLGRDRVVVAGAGPCGTPCAARN